MSAGRKQRYPASLKAGIAVFVAASIAIASSLVLPAQQKFNGAIGGRVVNQTGEAVSGATVHLEGRNGAKTAETKTDARGSFQFLNLKPDRYLLTAEYSQTRSRAAEIEITASGNHEPVDLILENLRTRSVTAKGHSTTPKQVEFADEPNFTVAGVTDWTAAGGHGNDSSLRTSEALTRETLTLRASGAGATASGPAPGVHKTEDQLRVDLAAEPDNFEANHALGAFYLETGKYADAIPLLEAADRIDAKNAENLYDLALACVKIGDLNQAHGHLKTLLERGADAKAYHLAAEIDERRGDPLTAVREYEQAARRDPSEQNYFDWGSELLYHRAVWQAKEVFAQGAKAYPRSERMLTALGGALFAGALYDEAAQRLCQASDLNPADPEPYLFMGKIEMAAPNSLACVGPKLERFAQEQPGNVWANYYYAMALWKQAGEPADDGTLDRVESALERAVSIDHKCGDAYLQLGNLYSTRKNYQLAIAFYNKAINTNPQLSEAHYRLGVAYDRVGEKEKAGQEFQLHEKLEKEQAAEVERQRREVKQFLVVQPGRSAGQTTP